MDLATTDYVRSIVPNLSADQLANLAPLVGAASTLIRRWTNRQLSFAAGQAEVIAAEESGGYLLREYPVARIDRVAINRVAALSIGWSGPPVRRAAVELVPAAPGSIVASALSLTALSGGKKLITPIPFTALADPSLATLAAAVAAAPGGWTAAVQGGFELAGVEELVAGDGADNALDGVDLTAFADEPQFEVDRAAGIVTVRDSSTDDPFRSDRFGPVGSEDDIWNPTTGEIRVDYDAGYDPIPADIQLATAELVKALFERMDVSSVLQSERTDTWSWTAREFGEVVGGMPESVRQAIARYTDRAR